MRLDWWQQLLRFSGEGTKLNYGVTVAKDCDVQEKFDIWNLKFSSRYSLLTSSKVVLHHKPVYNMMKVTINASGMSIHVSVVQQAALSAHFDIWIEIVMSYTQQ